MHASTLYYDNIMWPRVFFDNLLVGLGNSDGDHNRYILIVEVVFRFFFLQR